MILGPDGTPSGTRTHTGAILSRLSLPLDYGGKRVSAEFSLRDGPRDPRRVGIGVGPLARAARQRRRYSPPPVENIAASEQT